MARFDVQRLAAVDLHGRHGTGARRRIILAEFVLGAVLCGAGGVLALSSDQVINVVIGVVLLGAAVNYVPLAVHAVLLSRPGALEHALEGVDLGTELRHSTGAQALVLVPGAIAVLAWWQLSARRTEP